MYLYRWRRNFGNMRTTSVRAPKTCFHKGKYTTLRNLFSQGWVHHLAKLVLTKVIMSAPLCESKFTCVSYHVERIAKCYNRRDARTNDLFLVPSKRNCKVTPRLPKARASENLRILTLKNTTPPIWKCYTTPPIWNSYMVHRMSAYQLCKNQFYGARSYHHTLWRKRKPQRLPFRFQVFEVMSSAPCTLE